MKRLIIASVACALASASPAMAATLNFTGIAAASCALILPIDGTLTLGGDLQSWSTATAASITAVNTSTATLNVTAPTGWSASPAGTPATTFAVSGNMTGTNNGALTGTSLARVGTLTNIGTTIASVSLAATAAAPYRAGSHTAQVTVTCSTP